MFRLFFLIGVTFSCALVSAQESSIEELKARITLLAADTTVTGSSNIGFADRILKSMERDRADFSSPPVPVSEVKENKEPHMTAVLWDSGCVHGENWERNALPALRKKGWRVDVRRVPSGHTPCPSFVLNDVHWTGYTTLKAHYNKISSILHGEETQLAVASSYEVEPKPVVQAAPVRRSIPPARRAWNYYGSGSLASHLRSHGIDPTGMSYQDMVNAHSHAHEGTWSSAMVSGIAYVQPRRSVQYVQRPTRRSFSGGCPGGLCP